MTQNTLPSIRIEIKPSVILPGEVGIFAAKALPKNSLVAEASAFDDIPYPWSIFHSLESNLQTKIIGFCSASETEFYGPRDFNYLPINWYMNHSCSPNVGFDKDGNFVAMYDIAEGDELAWDYAFNETNPNFKMDCLCGAKSCRSVITGNDWMILKSNPEKYSYFSEELKVFIQQHG